MGSLAAAWLTEVVLISYRAVKRTGQGTGQVPLPLPSFYAATFIVFGGLAMLPQQAKGFASITGWGFVVATFMNLYQPVPAGTAAGTAPTIAQQGGPTGASVPQTGPQSTQYQGGSA